MRERLEIQKPVIDYIIEACCRKKGTFSFAVLYKELKYYAANKLKDDNPAIYYHYNKVKGGVPITDTLERAFGKREPKYVIRANHIYLLDLLCYWAGGKGYNDMLDVIFSKDSSESIERPIIDVEIETILTDLNKRIDNYSLEGTQKLYNKGLRIAIKKKDRYAQAKLEVAYATMIVELEDNFLEAKRYLDQALPVFEEYNQNQDILNAKFLLSQVEAYIGDLVLAELYLSDYIKEAERSNDLSDQASGHACHTFIAQQRGDFVKALDHVKKTIIIGKTLTRSKEPVNVKNGKYNLGCAYLSNALIHETLGEFTEAKNSYLLAKNEFEILKKSQKQLLVLTNLARLEFNLGTIPSGEWLKYINEAKEISIETKKYIGLASGILVVAKVADQFHYPTIAEEIWKDGLSLIRSTKDKGAITLILINYAQFLISKNNFEAAETFISELFKINKTKQIAELNGAYELLMLIEEKRKNVTKRNEYLDILMTKYSDELKTEQSPIRKASILSEIANLYMYSQNNKERIGLLYKIANIYSGVKCIGQLTMTLLQIAALEMRIGKKESALERWKEVEDLVKGTGFYQQDVIAKLQLGCYFLTIKQFDKAKIYLSEAKILNEQYRLGFDAELKVSIEMLYENIKLHQVSDITFPFMINRLYEGINSKKAQPEQVIRFWYHKYFNKLQHFFYNSAGLKVAVIVDDLRISEEVSQNMGWAFDHFLITGREDFETSSDQEETFVYPFDTVDESELFGMGIAPIQDDKKKILLDDKLKKLSESIKIDERIDKGGVLERRKGFPQYFLAFNSNPERQFETVVGWKYTWLPKIAYSFFQTNSAERVIGGNQFVLPFKLHPGKDFLLELILSCNLEFIPVYINEEPHGDGVTIMERIHLQLPWGLGIKKTTAIQFKKLIHDLTAIEKSKLKATLNKLKLETEEMFSDETEFVIVTVLFVEFTAFVDKQFYPVLLINIPSFSI